MSAFTIIAESARRQLLDALLDGPKTVNTLVGDVKMSQPVVSKHLRILRDAGFVDVTRDGQRRIYSLRSAPLIELDDWLGPYRRLWSERLDALEHHLNDNP